MDLDRLSQEFDAYLTWKRELVREITRYRSWLAHNRLNSKQVEQKLEKALKTLRTDHITLAFVGEFSRGKSELINSLFFSEYGQRMLPSHAGRTTMCTTELFYDPRAERSYIHLLPIETRASDASVAQFKRVPKHWVSIALDMSDPEEMARAFSQVAKAKSMSIEQAINLGFNPEMLEQANTPDQVMVPAWRHALVNIDHPLLRRGLRILDTPGLNALGSEPELTLSMLPSAQAIIFMLAADAGVTASDMTIWQQHIRQLDDDYQGRLFAVLNKIDVLWDDLYGANFVDETIAKVQASTAKQLGLSPDEILPLSAKQALLAKVRQDPVLLNRSRMPQLEALLCERIIAQKETLLQNQVVHQVMVLINNSRHALNVRLQRVNDQLVQLNGTHLDDSQVLSDMTNKTKAEHSQHHKRLLGLKTNQRLMQRQSQLLLNAVRADLMQEHLSNVRRNLTGSWTTYGINQAILQFFQALEQDLDGLELEAERANKMVSSIYQRHNEEFPLHGADAPLFIIRPYRNELKQLQAKGDQFRLQLKSLLTEQRSLTRRFFATLAQEATALHQRLRHDVAVWGDEALMPLIQHTLEHKQMLETHILRLHTLSREKQKTQARSEQLRSYQQDLQQQLTHAAEMLHTLRKPAPVQRKSKVVTLTPSAVQML